MHSFIKKNKESIAIAICFLFFTLFFSIAHPIFIFDTDDWTHIGQTRSGIPDIHNWNPTRILPEVFMPICTEFAINIVFPFNKNLLDSITITFAIITSGFITFYICSFYCLVKKYTEAPFVNNIFICILFTLLHFMILRTDISNNTHLFYTYDATCYFYYIIPNLICASITFWGINKTSLHSWWLSLNNIGKGLFILLIYVCLVSNLFPSLILITFAFTLILRNIFNTGIKDKKSYKNSYTEIFIILGWLIILYFEYSGGRSKSFGQENGFMTKLPETINYLAHTLRNINSYFIMITVCCVLLYLYYKNDMKERNMTNLILLLCMSVFCFPCIIILCTATIPYYIERGDILFSIFFECISISMLIVAVLTKKYSKLNCVLPLIIFLVYCETNTRGKTFKDLQNVHNITYHECQDITNNLIKQVKEADRTYKDSMNLYVPKFHDDVNWPISYSYGERISNSLYKYGFINKPINITVVPIEQKHK